MGEENASQLGCQRDETKARDSSSFSRRRDVEGVKGGLTSRHSLLLGIAMSRSLFKIEKKIIITSRKTLLHYQQTSENVGTNARGSS